MPLPSILTFNELNGEEVRHVLENRFEQVMKQVPYFQRHITLPRVSMALQIKLEVYADQPHPEVQSISDRVDVVTDRAAKGEPADVIDAETTDSAAPVDGGQPPDQIRERHGLPIPQPMRGSATIGAQIVTSDHQLEGREVEDLPGLKISRTGTGMIDGMPTSANATVAKIDQGPAGLRGGRMDRNAWQFGGGRK